MTFPCPFTDITICDNIPTVTSKKLWYTGFLYSKALHYKKISPNDEIFNISPAVKFIDEYQRPVIAIKYNFICPSSNASKEAVISFLLNDNGIWASKQYLSDGLIMGSEMNKTWAENLIFNKPEFIRYYPTEMSGGEECSISIAGNNETPVIDQDI